MKQKKTLPSAKKLLSSLRRGTIGNEIKIIGVLGTLGKTTTAHMLWHLLVQNNVKAGLLSSDGFFSLDEKDISIKANNLDSNTFAKVANDLVAKGYEFMIVEVSSKSIINGAFDRIKFDSGIITNIKHHDKDLYENWDEYADWKLNFINSIKEDGLLIVDSSNELLDWLESNERQIMSNILLYIASDQEFNKSEDAQTQKFKFEGEDYEIDSYLDTNIKNAVFAMRMAQSYLTSKKSFVKEFSSFKMPMGRNQLVEQGKINIIIDNARRKEEVQASLTAIRKKLEISQRLIAVVGAEGSVDTERKKVALGALNLADIIIIAPTDPRREEVQNINSLIISYIEKEGATVVDRFSNEDEFKLTNKESLKLRVERVLKNGDTPVISFDENNYSARIDAIEAAIRIANVGDTVYLSGKGNDDTMFFDGVEYEWSDFEALRVAQERL